MLVVSFALLLTDAVPQACAAPAQPQFLLVTLQFCPRSSRLLSPILHKVQIKNHYKMCDRAVTCLIFSVLLWLVLERHTHVHKMQSSSNNPSEQP